MKPFLPLPRLTCLLLSLSGSIAVLAQSDTGRLENMSLKELLNVKVAAPSKSMQEIGLAPAAVILVTRAQIRARGYQSLLDLMYDLPEMKVDDKILSGIRNGFTVRGTQGIEKFLLLLDGVRISSPSGEAMPVMENYPVNLAERVEIVYGPASALYGADAVSGVINIITRKPGSSRQMIVDAQSAAGSYGYTNTSLFLAKRLNDDADLTVSAQYADDPGPDYSKLYRGDSAYDVSAYSTGTLPTLYGPFTPVAPVKPRFEAPLRAYNVYAAAHINDFTLAFFRGYSRTPTAYGNNPANALYNRDVSMAQSVNTANASYQRTLGAIRTSTSLMSSEYNLDPNSNYRNLYTAMEPAYKYSTCSEVRAEEQLDYKASEKLHFTAGAVYERHNALAQSADLEKPVKEGDYVHGIYLGSRSLYRPEGLPAQFYLIKYHNTGAYAQAQMIPYSRLHITLGARVENNSWYGSTFDPRAAIVFNATRRTTVKLLYGSAFLSPAPTEAYGQWGSFYTQDSGRTYHSSFLHLPNPGLKPIRSNNLELGIRHNLTDNLILSLDGYYNTLRGLHAYADDNNSTRLYNNSFNGIPVDYIEVFVNDGRQKNYGGSLQLNWKFTAGNAHVNVLAAASYTDGVQEEESSSPAPGNKDMQIDFISPWMGYLQGDIREGRLTCSPRLVLMGRQRLTGIADTAGGVIRRQTIPGYALLNISLRYALTDHFSLFANLSNALNQHYRSVGFNMDLKKTPSEVFYGQREDPIRVLAGVNLTF
ncbi:MAG TPA: TonB-dependent receptor [Puia sp.]|uniref:TonB-dependent receptor plug domain-containing protein n=1 Tax=Puia sp. TaxID=2045100 RepID=UPI002CE74A21|nr:TonB-dependent receptor [Puia sp.]HVU96316.1 TonB-dependent receptor [Puia sp.]